MADDVELPELPPKWKWRQGTERWPLDWDVFDEENDLCYWVNYDGSIAKAGVHKEIEAPTQQEGMQLLATRLWLGMEDFGE